MPTLPKVRTDIATIKRILEAKKVRFEEVRSGCVVHTDGTKQQCGVPHYWLAGTQVDLTTTPERRDDMLAGSDSLRVIPQLHVNGKVSIAVAVVLAAASVLAVAAQPL